MDTIHRIKVFSNTPLKIFWLIVGTGVLGLGLIISLAILEGVIFNVGEIQTWAQVWALVKSGLSPEWQF